MSVTRALYRLWLLALPREMRLEHGREMEEIFIDRLRAARASGGLVRLPAIWTRALFDVASAARESRRVVDTARMPLQGEPMTTASPAHLVRSLWQDTRFAARLLLRDRAFTITALVTLAVCIAANTIIFTVVDAIVLRPLPVAHAERLLHFSNSYPNAGAPRASNGVPDYFDRRQAMPSVEEFALYRRQGATLAVSEGAARITALRATPSLVPLIDARPALGQLFRDDHGVIGKEKVVVLSHGLWQREFGGDPSAIGRTVRLNSQPHEIIGVLPADFAFIWNDIDLWLPAAFTPDQMADDARHSNSWQMIGRLAPGATIAQAQEQLNAINARNDERFPAFREILRNAGFHSYITDFQAELTREVRPTLYLLWGGVLLVLLLGCVNIANLVLVRSTRRTRELATRQAMGADRKRLRWQLLTESVLLSVTGGVAGVVLGWSTLRVALAALHVDDLPRGFEVSIGPAQVAAILALSIAVGLLLGLMPAARASRLDVNQALRDDNRGGTAGRGTLFLRRALATTQIAMAFILLVGAGLLLSSFRAVLKLDPGFRPEGVITAAVSLPLTGYPEAANVLGFHARLLETVTAIPGVSTAGLIDVLPMSGDSNDSVIIPEGYTLQPGDSLISPNTASTSDDYFRSMGIELVTGRFFDSRDQSESARVAIIDERLAARFFPGRDAVGRRMYKPDSAEEAVAPTPNTKWITIVGVVKNVRVRGFDTSVEPVGAYYFPMRQQPNWGVVLTVRTTGDPESLVAPIRRAVQSIDPDLPVHSVNTMAGLVDDALVSRRVPVMLSVVFGGVALFLAAIGIYGVLAYSVAERRREIGIRMALGSTTADVFRHVLRDGLTIVAAGLAVGVVGAFFAGRAMQSLLYGVEPTDAGVGLSVAALLAVVAVAATVLPARRAMKVSPSIALQG